MFFFFIASVFSSSLSLSLSRCLSVSFSLCPFSRFIFDGWIKTIFGPMLRKWMEVLVKQMVSGMKRKPQLKFGCVWPQKNRIEFHWLQAILSSVRRFDTKGTRCRKRSKRRISENEIAFKVMATINPPILSAHNYRAAAATTAMALSKIPQERIVRSETEQERE